MATASSVQLSSSIEPQYHHTGGDSTASATASQLLQENHEKHHIFFNSSGFHNHVAHHLLSLWALKATSEQLQSAYNANKTYQRPPGKSQPSTIQDLHDPAKFTAHLGPRDHYNDFLVFFTSEIQALGWQHVLQKYVFARNALADNMLVRMHSGFLHPIIHLGFGIEFAQPAIIAEALAQAACHDDWIGDLLLPAEHSANSSSTSHDATSSSAQKSIVSLIDKMHADAELRAAPRWADDNKIRDGVLARAADRMVSYAAQVRVLPAQLAEKTAEMTNAVAYYSAGAQRKDKMVKFDFYFIHCFNSSIFYPTFLKQDWLAEADKVRLLEWKIRMDLAMYVSRKSPEILMSEIREYRPKQQSVSGWEAVEKRACGLDQDDGHAVKLVRAMANGQAICKPYEESEAFRLKQSDWLQLGHMAIDSVEAPGDTWVRSAGWDEAWENVPAKLKTGCEC